MEMSTILPPDSSTGKMCLILPGLAAAHNYSVLVPMVRHRVLHLDMLTGSQPGKNTCMGIILAFDLFSMRKVDA
ncbi:hypothetical protein SK128_001347, partial [Halocaridina rubra]